MSDTLSDIDEWQASIANKSTRDTHLRYLLPAAGAVSQAGRGLRQATAEELRAFIRTLSDPGREAYTAEAIRSFFKWAVAQGKADEVPLLVATRPVRRKARVLEEDAVRDFLDALRALTRNEGVFLYQRQMLARAAVEAELIYACGILPAQLVALQDDDVQSEPAGVSIALGPERRRIVPVTASVLEAIEYWKDLGREPGTGASWLLHSRNKPHIQCDAKKVGFDLRLAAKHVGVLSTDFSARSLRRAFAKHMLGRGFGEEHLAFVLCLNDLRAFQLGFLED